MFRITWLFCLFAVSSKGRVRVARWRELRDACLDRSYPDRKKKVEEKGAEA